MKKLISTRLFINNQPAFVPTNKSKTAGEERLLNFRAVVRFVEIIYHLPWPLVAAKQKSPNYFNKVAGNLIKPFLLIDHLKRTHYRRMDVTNCLFGK